MEGKRAIRAIRSETPLLFPTTSRSTGPPGPGYFVQVELILALLHERLLQTSGSLDDVLVE